jgi:hypothetical protein
LGFCALGKRAIVAGTLSVQSVAMLEREAYGSDILMLQIFSREEFVAWVSEYARAPKAESVRMEFLRTYPEFSRNPGASRYVPNIQESFLF